MRSASSPRAVSMITGTCENGRRPAADREPIEARQHQIEHDEVRPLRLSELARPDAVAGLERPVAVAPQVADDDLPHDRLVVHDQDGLHGSHCDAQRFPESEIGVRHKPFSGAKGTRKTSSIAFAKFTSRGGTHASHCPAHRRRGRRSSAPDRSVERRRRPGVLRRRRGLPHGRDADRPLRDGRCPTTRSTRSTSSTACS